MPLNPRHFSVLGLPAWSLLIPALATALLAVPLSALPDWAGLSLISVSLIGAVLVAVFHAEVVAHRIGEPFGTLVLALAVTVAAGAWRIAATDPNARRCRRFAIP